MVNFRKAKFIAGFATYQQNLQTSLPEFAFWGRSNVGKSSLIRALTDNNNLVRVSKTPGCTRQINLFSVDDRLILADLPGYGYSKVSKQEVMNWKTLIDTYFSQRKQLRAVFVLIDSRRGLMEVDRDTLEWLIEYNINFIIVLTKIDKQSKFQQIAEEVKQEIISIIRGRAEKLLLRVIPISSHKKFGISDVSSALVKLL